MSDGHDEKGGGGSERQPGAKCGQSPVLAIVLPIMQGAAPESEHSTPPASMLAVQHSRMERTTGEGAERKAERGSKLTTIFSGAFASRGTTIRLCMVSRKS